MTANIGMNLISIAHWDDYQLPALHCAKPSVVKFNMFYDGNVQVPVFGSQHLDPVLDMGAKTVILRTAETNIGPDAVQQQLTIPMSGWQRSILDYIQIHPQVKFIIEVGNEPDRAGVNAWVQRWYLLQTAQKIAPLYRQSHPNLTWIASLSTKDGGAGFSGPDYFNALMTTGVDGALTSSYAGFGVHAYGYNTLYRDDANSPWAVSDWVYGFCDNDIWVTEAGIDAPTPWSFKAHLYVDAMKQADPRIKGATFFTYSRDPFWYNQTHYAVDVSTNGEVDWSFRGSKTLAIR
jgi:hypothetical protein